MPRLRQSHTNFNEARMFDYGAKLVQDRNLVECHQADVQIVSWNMGADAWLWVSGDITRNVRGVI